MFSDRTRPARTVIVALSFVVFAGGSMVGPSCNCKPLAPSQPAGPAVVSYTGGPIPPDPNVGSPDAKKIRVNIGKRTIKLYELENKRAQWIVRHPLEGILKIDLKELECRVPKSVPMDDVEIYYLVPGVAPSPAVKVRDCVKEEQICWLFD